MFFNMPLFPENIPDFYSPLEPTSEKPEEFLLIPLNAPPTHIHSSLDGFVKGLCVASDNRSSWWGRADRMVAGGSVLTCYVTLGECFNSVPNSLVFASI